MKKDTASKQKCYEPRENERAIGIIGFAFR